jgi:hypothetical protein
VPAGRISFHARSQAIEANLDQNEQRGVLHHLGVSYANFITDYGEGMDVEPVKLFAHHVGVRYEYVPTDRGHRGAVCYAQQKKLTLCRPVGPLIDDLQL